MTKTAVLPTGEQMHFPDETPDEHVHAQVRAKLGLPPPENDAVRLEQRLQQLTTAVGALQQQMAQAASAYQQQISTLAQAFQRQLAQVENVADSAVKLHASSAHTGEMVDRIVNAVNTPKKAVKQSDGSWKAEAC